MKIEKVETKKLEMPYTKPLVTATNNFTVARGLLVTVVTNGGVEGYGYSDLFPRAGETPETAQHVIESLLKAKVIGKELEDLARIRADIDHFLTGHPRAKSALESALFDALARSCHIPLYVMLGGKFRSEIKVIKMVSVGTPEASAAFAISAVTRTSSGEGAGSPDGWQCTTMMPAALAMIADRNTSATRMGELFNVP